MSSEATDSQEAIHYGEEEEVEMTNWEERRMKVLGQWRLVAPGLSRR